MPTDQLPDCVLAAQAQQRWDLLEHGAQAMKRLGRKLYEAHLEDLLRLQQQLAVAVAIGRLYPCNLSQRLIQRAAVVEVTVVCKVKPVPRRQRHQLYMLFKLLAEQCKQFFKQKRRGDDGGPGVVFEAIAFKHLCSPTEPGTAVDERDLVAFGSQAQRRCDTAKAGANDKCFHGVCEARDRALTRSRAGV